MGIFSRDNKPNALVAAGRKIKLDDRTEVKRTLERRQAWQEEAWDFFDAVGEVKQALGFMGNALRKVRLFAAERQPDDPDGDPVETKDGRAIAALDRLRSGLGDHGELLADAAVNLNVAGEGYLLGMNNDDDEEEFTFRSVSEFRLESNKPVLIDPDDPQNKTVLEGDDVFFARIWLHHPRFRDKADSPLHGVLSTCEQILILERAIRVARRNRAILRGIFALPSEATFGPQDPTQEGDERKDPFMVNLEAHLTAAIMDESSMAAASPLLLRLAGEHLDKAKLFEFDDKVEGLLDEQKENIQRLGQGLNIPPEVIKGISDVNHWCVDEETEILTDSGWKTHSDLVLGDVVLTLDHETGLSEWHPVEDIYRAYVVDEPMLALEGRNHSSLTTLNHRWPTIHTRYEQGNLVKRREWATSSELNACDWLITGAPCSDQPTEAKFRDDFVELVAWFWTEGHARGPSVSIAQSHTVNETNVARIRALLTRLIGPASESLRGNIGAGWRECEQQNSSSFGGPVTVFHLSQAVAAGLLDVAPDKIVQPWFIRSLTPTQLHLFVTVSQMADGRHFKQGSSDIWQKNPEALNAYELALILLGRMTSRTDEGRQVDAWSRPTVRPIKAAEALGRNLEPVSYTGTVWCPTTANHTWLARRRGKVFYTGNSGWMIRDETWAAHFQPLTMQILSGLTSAFYRPQLAAAGIEDPSKFVIWFDPSRVIVRPERGKDADDAFDRGALNWDAYRKAKGFDEDDKPTPEELAAIGAFLGSKRPVTEITSPAEDTNEDAEQAPPEEPETEEPATDAVTAASPPKNDIGAKLFALDQALKQRLHVATDIAMSRALEKAGARIKSKTNGNKQMREAIAGAALDQIGQRLGPSLVATLGLDEKTLVEDALASLEPRFDSWTKQTQRKALDAIPNLSASERQALEARQDEDRSKAWAWTFAALTALAAKRLYEPVPSDQPGEMDASVTVPFGLIRESVARAGGDEANLATSKVGAVGGIATGNVVMGAFQAHGAAVEGYEWVYGVYPRTPFPPHEALDGVFFENWDDPVLTNTEGWPETPFFYPGDHSNGCVCDFMPAITLTSESETEPLALAAGGAK